MRERKQMLVTPGQIYMLHSRNELATRSKAESLSLLRRNSVTKLEEEKEGPGNRQSTKM
jgi:hypothetical protein